MPKLSEGGNYYLAEPLQTMVFSEGRGVARQETLAVGTMVRVTTLDTKESATVEILSQSFKGRKALISAAMRESLVAHN